MALLSVLAFLVAASPESIQLRRHAIREQYPSGRIEIDYPEVLKASRFNETVQQILQPRLKAFRQFSPECPGHLNGTYTAATLRSGVVSVLFEFDEYCDYGAAHPPPTELVSINYDVRTDHVLALSDLFRPGTNYLARLSEATISDLKRRGVPVHREGASPVEGNFTVFTLTDPALVLHFEAYQVSDYASGQQTVVIPFDKLAPLLRKR
jgi:Protein of unknown function (DUF3298)